MRLKRAFTLVELLVVIAVIAILAALLLPALAAAKEKGYRAQCINNLKQLSLGIQAYADDHGDQLPGPVWSGFYENYDNVDSKRLSFYIATYLGRPAPSATPQDNLLARCPSAVKHWKENPGEDMMSIFVPLSYVACVDLTNVNSGVVTRPFGYPYASLPFNLATNEPPKLAHQIYNPSISWALRDADQQDTRQAAGYYNYLPVTPTHGNVREELFFDWHVAAVGK